MHVAKTWNILHVALTVYLFDFKKDIFYTRSSQDKSHDLSVSVRISTAAGLASTRRRHYKHSEVIVNLNLIIRILIGLCCWFLSCFSWTWKSGDFK